MTPGHRLKFNRAAAHFNEASELLSAYVNAKQYVIRRDDDPVSGLTFWFTLDSEPPDNVALAIGDCIHNLRSALDHIVYELSCRTAKKDHVGDTAFPVYVDAKDWDEKDSKGKLRNTSGLHKLRGIPQAAVDRIKELQPFNGLEPMYWQRQRLLHVHRLDIADKHRSLNLAVAKVPEMGVYYGYDGPPLDVSYVHQGRVTAGLEVPILRFAPSVDPTTPVEPGIRLEVVFADPSPLKRGLPGKGDVPVDDWDVVATVRGLIWGVDAVLQDIARFV